MSDIESTLTMALTMTKGSRKPFVVRPLAAPKAKPAASPPTDAPACITPDQVAAIETRCQDHGISIDRVKAAAKVGALSEITSGRYLGAMAWIDKQIDAMEPTT